MALTTVTLHGQILDLDGLTPAVGTVTFDTLVELNDLVDNITYQPSTFVATLDLNGEFTIVLPATDNPDITPLNWVYQVYISTGTWRATEYVQLPFAPGVTEYADLTRLDYNPCAPSIAPTPIPPAESDLFVLKSGDTMTGNLIINANLQVNGDAGISDDLTVGDDLTVAGTATVNDLVASTSIVSATLTVTNSATITNDLLVGDDVTVGGDLGVTGLGTFGVSVNTPLVTTTTVNTSDLNATDDVTVGDDLQVTGDANVDGTLTAQYQGINGDVMRLISSVLSTNVTSGGELSPNVDPTKIDISATTGWIVDYNSTNAAIGPTNPQITYVNYAGATAVTPAFAPLSFYLLDSTGTLFQQATRPTATQRRQNLLIGLTVTEAGTIIVDQTIPVIPSQLNNQLIDLMNSLGPFIISGNVLTANGVNLSINKTVGPIFTRAFSQVPTYEDPHTATLAAQTPVQFRHATATGFASGVVTVLDVANYDPGGAGVVTPVGGGANTSTNFRIWGFANNTVTEQILIQYGQNTYSSLANAVAGIGTGTYIPNPLTVGGALIGWISVTRTATNLSDPTQAVFTKAPKFATP